MALKYSRPLCEASKTSLTFPSVLKPLQRNGKLNTTKLGMFPEVQPGKFCMRWAGLGTVPHTMYLAAEIQTSCTPGLSLLPRSPHKLVACGETGFSKV